MLERRRTNQNVDKIDPEGEILSPAKLKVDWIDSCRRYPRAEQFTKLKEGILRGVFRQKAAAAWFGCRAEKAEVTVLPGQLDVHSWLEKIDSMSHSWPKSCTVSKFQVDDLQARTFHLHRIYQSQACALTAAQLEPNENSHVYGLAWQLLACSVEWQVVQQSWAQWPDTPYQGGFHPYQEWQQQGLYMAQFMGSGPCRITMTLEATLLRFKARLAREQQEVEERKESRGQVKRWRTRQGVLQVKLASPTSEASPIAVDAEFEEVLRDVWAGGRRGLFAEPGHMRVALRVCIRDVSRLTVVGFVFWGGFVWYVCFVCVLTFDRRAPATCWSPHVLSQNDHHSCHAHGIRSKQKASFINFSLVSPLAAPLSFFIPESVAKGSF